MENALNLKGQNLNYLHIVVIGRTKWRPAGKRISWICLSVYETSGLFTFIVNNGVIYSTSAMAYTKGD